MNLWMMEVLPTDWLPRKTILYLYLPTPLESFAANYACIFKFINDQENYKLLIIIFNLKLLAKLNFGNNQK